MGPTDKFFNFLDKYFKVVVCIIIILIILVVALGGYFMYNVIF